MQVVVFLFRTVRTNADVVEDARCEGGRKTDRGQRFQMPFQNFTVALISGFSGRP